MKRMLALVLVAGCRHSPASTDVPAAKQTSTRVPDDPTVPAVTSTTGFVVFTGEESHVLPVAPGVEVQRYQPRQLGSVGVPSRVQNSGAASQAGPGPSRS